MMDWMIRRGSPPHPVTLGKIVEEVPGIKSFYFDYDRQDLTYRASQTFHLHLDYENRPGLYRAFSIASSPTDEHLIFTMKMREHSQYKRKLDDMEIGEKAVVLRPTGRFVLPEDSSRRVVFLGSGIGITPFRSMAKYATDRGLPHRITLLYANKTPKYIIYREEWEELQRLNPKLTVVHTMTGLEDAEEGWTGRVGGINRDLIHEYVNDPEGAVFYLCGAPSVVRRMTGVLRDMSVDMSRMLVDAFFGYD